MPNDQLHIDTALVHRLIDSQFPQWADLPIKPVEFSGWDNRTFHLGEHMTVRLPSDKEYAAQVQKEHYWLPKLAPHLPLPIPTPLAMGKPCAEYPLHWSIYQWLDGQTASIDCVTDLSQFATSLGRFLIALHQCDTTGGPVPSSDNFYRGGNLGIYDAETQQAIKILEKKIDVTVIKEIWHEALASTWQNTPVWVHGDVAIGNLLVENGQLNAVIDFGQLCIGDPACDLAIAWTFFKGDSRKAFRTTVPLDSATWARARGWVLWKTLIVCAALPGTNPLEIEKSWQIMHEVITDHKQYMRL